MYRRVVITAETAITSIGYKKPQILDNLIKGVSGTKKIPASDYLQKSLNSQVFSYIDYELSFDFRRKYRKTLGPAGLLACQAAKTVLEDAGLNDDFIHSGRFGVAFGSTQGSPTTQRQMYNLIDSPDFSFDKLDSTNYIKQMPHTTAANIAQMFGIRGRIISSCTACTTSSQSIGFAYETIKYGLQEAMLCGGADEYDLVTVAVFDKFLAASTEFNDSPQLTPRPFDRDRDGLVVGEGAGALILEDYEFAKKRGATMLAEVIGFTCRSNGGDLIQPQSDGIILTLNDGLKNAGISADTIDFVSAHATATPIGDAAEAQAISCVYPHKPFVTGLKSYIGHTMATCGSLESIFTLYMMQENLVIPTLNLENIDPECNMINHVPEVMKKKIHTACIQNFAFGGVNSVLFLKRI